MGQAALPFALVFVERRWAVRTPRTGRFSIGVTVTSLPRALMGVIEGLLC